MKALLLDRTAQRAFAIRGWLEAKSPLFSGICQEEITHREVIVGHAYAVVLLLIIGLAGTLEGGGL